MLYFKKGDYCEQILDPLIYAANNIFIIFILVGITVLTNVKYLNLNILYIYVKFECNRHFVIQNGRHQNWISLYKCDI